MPQTNFKKLHIIYPNPFPAEVLHALKRLDDRLGTKKFLKTYNIPGKSVKVMRSAFPLTVHFLTPASYNNSVHGVHTAEVSRLRQKQLNRDPKSPPEVLNALNPDVYVTNELGWFDYRVSEETVYINMKTFYGFSDDNMDYLELLAFAIVGHEIAHYLSAHFGRKSPLEPFPSRRAACTGEAGDAWELQTLGGSILPITTNGTVTSAYMLVFIDGQESKVYVSREYLTNFKATLNAIHETFPLQLTTFGAAYVAGETTSRRCHFSDGIDSAMSSNLPVMQPPPMRSVPCDKMGRRNVEQLSRTLGRFPLL